jgi:hypothetical protein
MELKNYGSEFTFDTVSSRTDFGRVKDGFYFYKKKYLDTDKKFFNYEVYIKDYVFAMDAAERFDEESSDAKI